MKQRTIAILVSTTIAAVVMWAILALPGYLVGLHQRSVIQELGTWESEYGNIQTRSEALRTAQMIEYAREYYVPREGYRSTPEMEDALESQRKKTINAFVSALRDYTHEDFGDDSTKWVTFLESQE